MNHDPADMPDLMCKVCHTSVQVTEFYSGEELTGFEYAHSLAFERLGFPPHDVEPMVVRPFDEQVGICDFCSAVMPNWRYPARTFDTPEVTVNSGQMVWGFGSVGDWGACDRCHKLIEADNYKALSDNAWRKVPGVHSMSKENRATLKAALEAFHQQFRDSRLGPAINLLYEGR